MFIVVVTAAKQRFEEMMLSTYRSSVVLFSSFFHGESKLRPKQAHEKVGKIVSALNTMFDG